MNDILFSIIVPCYNVQDYLTACAESLMNQTYRNYEVLLIDDGSTDNTPAICDQLGTQDVRFRVYHKANGGLSDARNYGLDRARGEYVVFVDSDDFITENALHDFYESIRNTKPDVLLTRLMEYYGEDDIVQQDENMSDFFESDTSADKALLWEMNYTKSSWPAPKKILSKAFVDNYKLRFLKGYLHEDVDWSSRVMMHAERFEICTEPWYYHRMQRSGSITNTISQKRIIDVIEMATMLINGDDMVSVAGNRKKLITDRLMRSVYPILSYYGQLSSVGKKEVVECCKSHKELFDIAPNFKYKVFCVTAKILGFKLALNTLAHIGGIV